MRIDKFLSNLKYGSRKDIKTLIKNNLIKVNDTIIKNESININPNIDIIKVNEEIVFYKEEINLMLHKPLDYLSANSDTLHKVVFELISEPYSRFDLKIAGRLDLDSSGLLILTNNGEFVHKITNPNNSINKLYEVELLNKINDLDKLLDGIIIKDGKNNEYLAKALKIEVINDYKVLITIDEGKFHQVRRMFKYLGNEVVKLKRIQIGKLKLNDLEVGKYIEFERSDLI